MEFIVQMMRENEPDVTTHVVKLNKKVYLISAVKRVNEHALLELVKPETF